VSIVQTIMSVEPNRRDFQIHGEVFKIVMDTQKNEWLYLMTKQKIEVKGQEPNDLVKLWALHFN
jgi:hypothetical protein